MVAFGSEAPEGMATRQSFVTCDCFPWSALIIQSIRCRNEKDTYKQRCMLRAKLSAMPRLRGRRGAFDGVGLEGALCRGAHLC